MSDLGVKYIPATPAEVRHMLDVVGQESVDALLAASIPATDRLERPLDLPAGLSEPDLVRKVEGLAGMNLPASQVASFLGGGAYRHFIPAAIKHLAGRGEFLTAYTPYQPEISQGTLQAMYEFQTMVCELLGMEVANASVYDGATALAEAVFMAHRQHKGKRGRILLAGAIHPDYQAVCCAYGHSGAASLVPLAPGEDGRISLDRLRAALGPDVCAVAVQSPNFFGLVEDVPAIAKMVHEAGALLVTVVTDAHACALLPSPGEMGADIAVAEGQALGLPLSFGGPYVGLFATRNDLIRQMPGRLVGRTVDSSGRDGFVLTMSTREQHIRRAKATSNICTNQGLCALQVSMYLSLLGPEGLRQVAERSHAHAFYLRNAIASVPGFGIRYDGPFFHEFVVTTPRPASGIVATLASEGVFAGIPLDRFLPGRTHELLVCATETNSRTEMDQLVARLAKEA